MILKDGLAFKLIIVISFLVAIVEIIVVVMCWADIVTLIVVRSASLVNSVFVKQEAMRVIETATS